MEQLKIQEYIPLAPLTTLKIGGNARFFVHATTEQHVTDAAAFANTNKLNLFILGRGSNVLISDKGFDGMVLQIGLKGVSSSEFRVPSSDSEILPNSKLETRNSELSPDSKLITAAAGEDWDAFVAFCVAENLAGVECLSGIPGFVGGTPMQNVGAYGQEVAETISAVRCLDRESGEFVTLCNADCGFTYRTSIFNSTHRERFIVLSVTFALRRGGEPKVVYKDLIEHFGEVKPTLSDVRNAVIKIRRSKSMVIAAGDPNSKSAGSFFKNPVVAKNKFDKIRTSHEAVPSFEYGDKVKIPAAWLIERSGFEKGFSYGAAGLSTNHTLALINRGTATAADIIALKDLIQAAVDSKFGIELQPEPIFIGF